MEHQIWARVQLAIRSHYLTVVVLRIEVELDFGELEEQHEALLAVVLHCEVDCRAAAFVGDVRVAARLQQLVHDVLILRDHSEMQRRLQRKYV